MSVAHNRSANKLKKKQDFYKSGHFGHRNHYKVADYYQRRFLNKLSFWSNKDVKNNADLTLVASQSNNNISTSSSGNEFEDGDVEDNDIINDYDPDFDQIQPKTNRHLDDHSNYFAESSGQSNDPLTIESYIFKYQNNEMAGFVMNEDSELNLGQKIGNFNTLKLNKSFKDLLLKVSPFRANTANAYEDREDVEEETDIEKYSAKNGSAEFSQDLKAKEKVLAYVDEAIDDVWGRIYDSSTFAEEEIMTLYDDNAPSYISSDRSHMNKNYRRNHSSFSSTTSGNSSHSYGIVENNTEFNPAFSEGNAKRRSTLYSMNLSGPTFCHDLHAQKWKHLEEKLKNTKTKMESSMTSKSREDLKIFWGLWDSIKAQCVQLLEVDEEQESNTLSTNQYKSVINNLERSRVYYN